MSDGTIDLVRSLVDAGLGAMALAAAWEAKKAAQAALDVAKTSLKVSKAVASALYTLKKRITNVEFHTGLFDKSDRLVAGGGTAPRGMVIPRKAKGGKPRRRSAK